MGKNSSGRFLPSVSWLIWRRQWENKAREKEKKNWPLILRHVNMLLEKEMATHCSILTWKISWTEEPDGLQSMGSQKVRHNWVTNTNTAAAAPAAKSLQSCPTLCDPRDGSSPGSPVPGILQARTLEWVAISFSNAWKWKGKVKWFSCVWLLATPRTAAYQAPPSMGFPGKSIGMGCHCLLQTLTLTWCLRYILDIHVDILSIMNPEFRRNGLGWKYKFRYYLDVTSI